MIVKNERHVIEESLKAAKPFIDYWVIVDTGSTDGTQDFIREVMKDIPGELYERPWVHFEHNRNEALALAKTKCDYILFMDADEVLMPQEGFVFPSMEHDFYEFVIRQANTGIDYGRVLLIKADLNWRWKGVVHETLLCPGAQTWTGVPNAIVMSYTNGSRSSDPQKYLKDAHLLEKALETEPKNSRYVYYLAQSYLNVPDYQKALKYYQLRSLMGGWDEEVFSSLLHMGVLQEKLDRAPAEFIESYWAAYRYRPTRVEPLGRLIDYYVREKNYTLGFLLAEHALSIPLPAEDSVFVERWMYEWGVLMHYGQCAYHLKKDKEAKGALTKVLAHPDVPTSAKEILSGQLGLIEGHRADLYR